MLMATAPRAGVMSWLLGGGGGGGGGGLQGAIGSRSLETTVEEVLLSNTWVKITTVVPLCLI